MKWTNGTWDGGLMEHGMVDKCEVIVKIEHDIEIRNGVMGKPCNIEYMEKNEHADIE